MRAAGSLDELRRHPHPVPRLAHAAFEDVAHAELAPDVSDPDRPSVVGKARVASDDEQKPQFRERSDDLVGDTLGEEILLWISAHIDKWQYRNRGLVGQRQQRPIVEPHPHTVYAHRPGDIAQLVLAEVVERNVQPAGDVFPHARRDAYLAGLGQCFQPSGDIDAVPEDIATLDDNVPDVDPDAFFDGKISIALHHCRLQFCCTAQRIDDA
jgi:hypothetical protein